MMMMQYPHKLTKQEVHDTLETGKLLLVGLNIVPPDVLEARRLFDVVRADCGDRDPRGFYLSEAMSAVPPCSFSSVMRRIRLLEFSSATRALFTRLGELLGITDTATVSELYVTKIENYMHKVEYDEVEQEALKSLMNETLTKLVPFCTAAADFYEAEEVCDLISMWAWLHSGLAKIRGHLEHTHHLITTTVALCGLLIPRAPLRSPQSHSISVVFTGADDEMKKESAKGNRLVWTIALHYGFADFAYARYLVGYREQEAVPDSFRFLSDDQDEAQIVSALCKDDGNALFSRTKVENAIYRACEERPQFQSKLIKRLADEPHIPIMSILYRVFLREFRDTGHDMFYGEIFDTNFQLTKLTLQHPRMTPNAVQVVWDRLKKQELADGIVYRLTREVPRLIPRGKDEPFIFSQNYTTVPKATKYPREVFADLMAMHNQQLCKAAMTFVIGTTNANTRLRGPLNDDVLRHIVSFVAMPSLK